jgi:hypothetical protein
MRLSVPLGLFRWRFNRKNGYLLARGACALGEAVLVDEWVKGPTGVCQLIVRNASEHVASEEPNCGLF